VEQGGPSRVPRRVVHYAPDECGGCQWQHVDIAAQRAAKAQLVVDAMQRIAGVALPHPDVIGDERTFGYRRTISLTVRGHGKRRVGGFHAASDPDTIVPIEQCLLAHPVLQRAWDALRLLLARLPEWRTPTADAPAARRGPMRRGQRSSRQQQSLRVSLRQLADDAVAVVVEGGDRWSATAARAIGQAVPGCRGIWWSPAGQEARLLWDRDRVLPTRVAATDASAPEAPQTEPLVEPPVDSELAVAASFVQVNDELAARMHAFVFALVMAEAPSKVIDGYAGAGRLAMALDAAGVGVVAIERDDRACRYSQARLGDASRVLSGTVEARLDERSPPT
jgi:tRNA/tmRNA/rRNA uracil-C5-methylase (TrmA/RlmC/RlmD family)